jgi:hypothetical protein
MREVDKMHWAAFMAIYVSLRGTGALGEWQLRFRI